MLDSVDDGLTEAVSLAVIDWLSVGVSVGLVDCDLVEAWLADGLAELLWLRVPEALGVGGVEPDSEADGVPDKLVVCDWLGVVVWLALCVPLCESIWLGEMVALRVPVTLHVCVSLGDCVPLGERACDGDGDVVERCEVVTDCEGL